MQGNDLLTVERTHRAGPARTRVNCAVAASFGLTLDDLAPSAPAPARFKLELPPAGIALITGPSGAGKTTLLRDIAEAACNGAGEWVLVEPPAVRPGRKTAVERVPGRSTDDRMRALAQAGLAEVGTALRPPGALSSGERERLRLALAIAKADLRARRGERVLLLIDEFAAALDDATARSAAQALVRFLQRTPSVRAVVATNAPACAASLRARTHIRVDRSGPLRVTTSARSNRPQSPCVIEQGSERDLQALAHHHYRPGKPATVARVLTARDSASGALAGVLVVSMPTLNGAWRSRAWPDRFDVGSKRERARRINDELRCISRVIVAPEYRGSGLAVRLVRAYIDAPLTPCTEAIAAMGGVCPFFSRAGMTPFRLVRSARDQRLHDALHYAGVRDDWRYATPDTSLARAIAGGGRAFVEAELRRWASGSRATRAGTGEPIEDLFARACRALAVTPVAYAHAAL